MNNTSVAKPVEPKIDSVSLKIVLTNLLNQINDEIHETDRTLFDKYELERKIGFRGAILKLLRMEL